MKAGLLPRIFLKARTPQVAYSAIPSVVFTNSASGACRTHEDEARRDGLRFTTRYEDTSNLVFVAAGR
jgi:hypothetical protein